MADGIQILWQMEFRYYGRWNSDAHLYLNQKVHLIQKNLDLVDKTYGFKDLWNLTDESLFPSGLVLLDDLVLLGVFGVGAAANLR